MQKKHIISSFLVLSFVLSIAGCGVRQDEITAMKANIAGLKTQIESLEEQVLRTSEPIAENDLTTVNEDEWVFTKGIYTAKLIKEPEYWIGEIIDPNLQDEYFINQLEEDQTEYEWLISITANNKDYQVGTTWSYSEVDVVNLTVQDMWTHLCRVRNFDKVYDEEAIISIEKDGTTIRWTFELPNDIDPKTVAITGIEICLGGVIQ